MTIFRLFVQRLIRQGLCEGLDGRLLAQDDVDLAVGF